MCANHTIILNLMHTLSLSSQDLSRMCGRVAGGTCVAGIADDTSDQSRREKSASWTTPASRRGVYLLVHNQSEVLADRDAISPCQATTNTEKDHGHQPKTNPSAGGQGAAFGALGQEGRATSPGDAAVTAGRRRQGPRSCHPADREKARSRANRARRQGQAQAPGQTPGPGAETAPRPAGPIVFASRPAAG
jgi:hypothetical protein